MATDVDFHWDSIVIGNELDAIRYAVEREAHVLRNRDPCIHSYEYDSLTESLTEEEWAELSYQLYEKCLDPFTDMIDSIRVEQKDKLIKVFTENDVYTIKYNTLSVFDTENVSGLAVTKEILYYRVIDWFDCKGLFGVSFDEIATGDDFINKIMLFKTRRIDGDQKYMDLLCESFLTEDQLKSFQFSDTMARFKTEDVLRNHGAGDVKMTPWKRDIYPVYENRAF
jgi:hypothetical protein